MFLLNEWWKGLIRTVFPKVCVGCAAEIHQKQLICTFCEATLPYTRFQPGSFNAVEKVFMGRIDLFTATSLFYYYKGSPIQYLIHQFKYYKNLDAGQFLSLLLARELKKVQDQLQYEAVVPVPLHPKKLKRRGYNQAEAIAAVIARHLNIPLLHNYLNRNIAGTSQTKKSRTERNLLNDTPFIISPQHPSTAKHILLIDDIITTGHTIEAAGKVILEKTAKLSVASLAYTIKH